MPLPDKTPAPALLTPSASGGEPAFATPAAPEPSLADHEAAFHPRYRDQGAAAAAVTSEPSGADEGERDDRGRFRARRRERSRATPEDVPRIQELATQLRIAKAQLAAQPGSAGTPERESQSLPAAGASAVPIPEGTAAAAPQEPAAPSPAAAAELTRELPATSPASLSGWPVKPVPEQFATYEQYWDARDAYNRQVWTIEAQLRAEDERLTTFWQSRVDAALKAYPDFDAVALKQATKIPAGSLMDAFILQSTTGAHVLYALQKDDALRGKIAALAPIQQAEALALLGQQLTAREQAAATGSAATPPPSQVPRPPNPVRTGPMHTSDELPGDQASIRDHEKVWGRRRR